MKIPLAAGSLAAVLIAAAVTPATATDLDVLRERAQRLGDEVSGLEQRLSGLREREAKLSQRIEHASRAIGLLETEIREAQLAHDDALELFVERAIEAYKGGGTSTELALLLSARDLSDIMLVLHATKEQAELDAEALAELEAAKQAAQRAQELLDARKQQLLASQARVEVLADEVTRTVTARRATLKELNAQVRRLEAEARAQAAAAPEPERAFLQLLSPSGPTAGIPDGFVGSGVTFEGIASWYGPGFEGNPTASGDIFDPDLFTAASKELPLGTWLYVEHEGKGVVVLVNDRGPYIEGRILDLSRAAAFSIGITGLGWIKAEILLKA